MNDIATRRPVFRKDLSVSAECLGERRTVNTRRTVANVADREEIIAMTGNQRTGG